ncbi:MAG: hypothetical protein HIU86_08995 [Acidobacteria bacterium]|nr:hypothetical protein [Acidobacteriota bacterium]
MSEVAAKPARPRRGRRFDLLAMLAIGVVIVSAALVPAVTANSGGTTTVRGDVTLNGRPLAFFPVGFWTTADGSVATTSTDTNGGFTLTVSDTLDGYAYAGTPPDATHAIMAIDGQEVVRGVMTTDKAVTPLYQGRGTATAKALFGGATDLHFRLQEAGRITGTSPVPASGLRAVQIRRADNSVVQTMKLDSRSRFQSMLLAPGQYGVVLVPKAPGLPTVTSGIVRSGQTTTVTLASPVTGATVLGTVRTGTHAVGQGVPVLLEQNGVVLASATTGTGGDWSFPGVAAGDYSVEVGRFDQPAAVSASASSVDVQIPGADPSPTATGPTASPSPAATASTPQAAAIEPVQRTADAVLPQTFPVTVPSVLGDVDVATQVQQAGRITGFVTVTARIPATDPGRVQVVVEEAATEHVVRVTTAGTNGRYDVGGLQPGRRYRVYAVTQPTDPTLALMGGTTAVARTTAAVADVIVGQPALNLAATVSGVTSGRVVIGDTALLQRTGTIDASGAAVLPGLVPGAYPVVVTTAGREASQPVGVVLSASQQAAALQPGPKPATFKGWFINSGGGVPVITGTATDTTGDVVRFGPQTTDGHVAIGALDPGTYTYDAESFRGTAPTVDGPWYYTPPTGGFTLNDGATTDVGPIVLHVKTH